MIRKKEVKQLRGRGYFQLRHNQKALVMHRRRVSISVDATSVTIVK